MSKSIEIINDLVNRGVAERVFENVIVFKPGVDPEKLAKLEHSYAKDYQQRLKARRDKEREAEIKLRDF